MRSQPRSRSILRASLAILLGFATQGHAEIVRLQFSGTIDSVFDETGELPPSIEVGAPFSGELVYDSAMTPALSQSDNFALYTFPSPPFALGATTGGVSFTSGDTFDFWVQETNGVNFPPGYWIRRFNPAEPVPGAPTLLITGIALLLLYEESTTLPDASLPTEAPQLEDFAQKFFSVCGCHLAEGMDHCFELSWSFEGEVTALPEATGSSAVAAVVLSALALLARRRATPASAHNPQRHPAGPATLDRRRSS